MFLKPLTSLFFAGVVALSASTASAQIFFDPTTWFAPPRPCYGPNCRPAPVYRPVPSNYAGRVGTPSYYGGNGNCQDGLCCPPNYRGNGYRGGYSDGQRGPRYSAPVVPHPNNGNLIPAPAPYGGSPYPGATPSTRAPYYDRYDLSAREVDWRMNDAARSGRMGSPFYP